MKRVFKFKEGRETEDLVDTGMYNFLHDYMLDPEGNYPKFKKDYKVTIIIEKNIKKR